MSPVPVEESPQRPGTVRKSTGLGLAAITALLIVAAFGAWVAWSRLHGGPDVDQQARLAAAIQRGRTLTAELASIKPPNQPDCPPGQSVKSFPADAAVPPGPNASGATPGKSADASQGTFAKVLSDYLLAQRLEQTTAMVIAFGKDRNGSIGSGFFIAPDLLVTNRHVIAIPNADLYLTSKSLAKVRRAVLVKSTEGNEIGSSDFALLRMIDGVAPGYITMAEDVSKLAAVVASGYPAFVSQDDLNYEKLLKNGDLTAAPDLSVTQGAVQAMQPRAGGETVVVHTASISSGNSGGPLVDSCGRVVGINTFIKRSAEDANKVNYAIHVRGVEAFLASAGVTFKPDSRFCGAR